ncbi:MAG: ATP synthase F0 subunit C [Candidatus Gastranaerophilales bacterium]|nr:ATP synthase F0 subunit C [Candidatus Gastranaerophilales bacterium]
MSVEQVAAQGLDLAKLGAGIAIGFGAVGAGLGLGIATKGLMEAISRQPEIAGQALIYFIIGAGLAEATAIYALFIALQLIG